MTFSKTVSAWIGVKDDRRRRRRANTNPHTEDLYAPTYIYISHTGAQINGVLIKSCLVCAARRALRVAMEIVDKDGSFHALWRFLCVCV